MPNYASVPLPTGVSCRQDHTIYFKGRSSSKTYMEFKPVPLGIRFYAVVVCSHCYLHSLLDNRSQNQSGHIPLQQYNALYRQIRRAIDKTVGGSLVPVSYPYALWCTQIGHEIHSHPCRDARCLVRIDSSLHPACPQ